MGWLVVGQPPLLHLAIVWRHHCHHAALVLGSLAALPQIPGHEIIRISFKSTLSAGRNIIDLWILPTICIIVLRPIRCLITRIYYSFGHFSSRFYQIKPPFFLNWLLGCVWEYWVANRYPVELLFFLLLKWLFTRSLLALLRVTIPSPIIFLKHFSR